MPFSLINVLEPKTRNGFRNAMKPVWSGLAVFLISVIISGLLTRAEYQKFVSDEHAKAINHGNILRTRVDRELNALLFISSGLSAYLSVYHKALDPEKIEAILADLHARSRHVRNLGVAVGFRLTYVYPLKSNEKIIGVDFRDLPKQWPQVKQAVDTRQGVLSGPLQLVQGGKGLIYRYPVFIDNEYWGILSTVINTDDFLKSAFEDISTDEYQFAIRLRTMQVTEAFYGNPALFENPFAFRMTSQVPNGYWEWAIVKHTSEIPTPAIVIGTMGIIISLLLGGLAYHQMHERRRLAMHALQDSLTGLANRRLLQDRMQQAYEQAKRFGRSMAVIYIDLDHFKRINDTHGHDFGDEYLKTAARKLASCLRSVDTLSRIGGDEFVIVLEELGEPADAYLVAENILRVCETPERVLDMTMRIELSMGLSLFPSGSDLPLPELMKQADKALYAAKAAGRNTYRIFGDD